MNLPTVALSMPSETGTQLASTYTLAHSEKEAVGLVSMPEPIRRVSAASNAATARPTASAVSNDELPPLPADIASPPSRIAASDSEPTSFGALNRPTTSPGAADNFPPLPVDNVRPLRRSLG